jgi:hypothetical protein
MVEDTNGSPVLSDPPYENDAVVLGDDVLVA